MIYIHYCSELRLVTGVGTTGLDLVVGVESTGEVGTVGLWWIPVGIAAWFLVSVAVGLCVGPVLGRCSQVRESMDQPRTAVPGPRAASRDERQASRGRLSTRTGIAM